MFRGRHCPSAAIRVRRVTAAKRIPMDTSLHVISPPTLREKVAQRLRDAIASGRFRPGERLIERELCELMSVSRTSIREALRELESERLVTMLPNRGPMVATIDAAQAESIYQIRAALESMACRIFVRRATDAQVQALADEIDALGRAYGSGQADAALTAKRAFYRILMEGSGNEIAAQMLRNIHIRVSQLRLLSLAKPSREKQSLREFREMVAAIRKRDEEAAAASCVRHVENAAAAALAGLAAGDAPTAPARRQRAARSA
jgi:DNA-binding GntR family transcriptional regulator